MAFLFSKFFMVKHIKELFCHNGLEQALLTFLGITAKFKECLMKHTMKGTLMYRSRASGIMLYCIISLAEIDTVFKIATDFTVPITLVKSFLGNPHYSTQRAID